VDEWVTAVVLERLSDPRVLAGLGRDAVVDDALLRQLDELAVLRARRDEAADSYAAGEISAAVLARVEAALTPQIATAERRVRPAVPVPDVVQDLAGHVDVGVRWEGLPLLSKRLVISSLVEVAILPAKQGCRQFDPGTVRVTPR
jgi:site-specific DNA recombinase